MKHLLLTTIAAALLVVDGGIIDDVNARGRDSVIHRYSQIKE